MATTAELRDHPHGHWELAFLIDGIARGFVSHADLEVLDSGDGREYVRGLRREGLSRRIAVDPRNGRLTPLAHTIDVEDHRGDLPALFATDSITVEPLETNIQPGDDLSGLTQFHDKWIGTEKIGPAGERHQYPVPLGFNIGLQHHTLHEDAEDSENPMTPPPVSDVPVLWAGRRCMLYRVWRDHIGNSTLDAGVIADFDVVTLKNGVGGTTGTADGTDLRGGPRRERRLNGTTDRVDWANVQQISNAASSGAGWVYFDEVASSLRIIFNTSSAANSFTVIFRRDTTRLDFAIVYTGGGAVNLRRLSDTGQVEAGRWHHVAYTYDGSGLAAGVTLYVDGEEVSGYTTSTDGVGTPQVDSGPWSLGGRVNVDTNNLQGRVGNRFRIWNRTLSHSSITTEFQTSYGFRPYDEWEPIWWGTLRDQGKVRARVWSMNCSGVESWLQRDLGSLYQTEPTPVSFELRYIKNTSPPTASLPYHESGIAIRIFTNNEDNGGAGGGLNGYYGDVQWDQNYQFDGDTIGELRDNLIAAIANAATIVGTNGAWNTYGFLDMSGGSKTISFGVLEQIAERAQVIIAMHRKLWGYLGFDIGNPGKLGSDNDPDGFYLWETAGAHDEPPGDGYVFHRIVLQGNDVQGDTAVFPPLNATLEPHYKGGVVSLDPAALKDGLVMLLGDAIISG